MRNIQLPYLLKTAFSVALIGGAGLLASGCGTTTKTTAQTYDIRVWRYGIAVDPFRGVFKNFKKQHPDSNISYPNSLPSTSYETASLNSLASRTGPELWSYPDGWIGDEEERVVALPDNFFGDPKTNGGKVLADLLKTSYPPNIASQLTTTDNRVLGLASNVDSLRLYINNSVLNNALTDYRQSTGLSYDSNQFQAVKKLLTTPPQTWDNVLSEIPYIVQRSGNNINRAAIALGTADNTPDADSVLQLLMYQNGAQIVNADRNRSSFSSQQTTPSGGIVRPGEKALTFFTSFANPASAAYTWSPSMPQAVDAFAQGKVAMVIAYADFGSQLQYQYPRFHPDIAPVPQITGYTSPVNLSRFSADSVTKSASSIPLSEQLLYDSSATSVVADLANSAGLRSPYMSTLQKKGDFLSQAALTTQTVYKRHHLDFDAAFLQMIRDVSQNGSTSAGAIDQAATKINALLAPSNSKPSTNF